MLVHCPTGTLLFQLDQVDLNPNQYCDALLNITTLLTLQPFLQLLFCPNFGMLCYLDSISSVYSCQAKINCDVTILKL